MEQAMAAAAPQVLALEREPALAMEQATAAGAPQVLEREQVRVLALEQAAAKLQGPQAPLLSLLQVRP
jgi:hypothetical protein